MFVCIQDDLHIFLRKRIHTKQQLFFSVSLHVPQLGPTRTYTYVYIYMCICMYIYTCMYVSKMICIHVYTHLQTKQEQALQSAHTHRNLHHTHTYKFVNTHIYTCMYVSKMKGIDICEHTHTKQEQFSSARPHALQFCPTRTFSSILSNSPLELCGEHVLFEHAHATNVPSFL